MTKDRQKFIIFYKIIGVFKKLTSYNSQPQKVITEIKHIENIQENSKSHKNKQLLFTINTLPAAVRDEIPCIETRSLEIG